MKLLVAFGKALLTMAAIVCVIPFMYWMTTLPLWSLLSLLAVALLAFLTFIYYPVSK